MKIYSGFGSRFIAVIIDILVLIIPNVILISLNLGVVCILLTWLYYSIFESSPLQATIGKMALKIIVVDINGKRLSFLKSTARYCCKFISAAIFLAGYIMVAFTHKKQGFHDMIVGTLVIKKTYIAYDNTDSLTSGEIINWYIEDKPLIIKFMIALLIITGILFPLSLFVNHFLLKISIQQVKLYSIIFFGIAFIVTGIGFRKRKNWAWWLGGFFFSYLFITFLNSMINVPAGINEKLGFVPFTALFLILLYRIYTFEVMNYFKISIMTKKKIYLIFASFLILSVIIQKFLNINQNI